MPTVTETQLKVLQRAACRERGNICPIVGVNIHAAAEMAVINALVRKGYITDNKCPYITDAGRAVVNDLKISTGEAA